MADEEERLWSLRHSHETSIVSYGHFGTPSYNEESKDWTFLRKDVLRRSSETGEETESEPECIRILDDPKLVVASSDTNTATTQNKLDVLVVKKYPELAAVPFLNKTMSKERTAGNAMIHEGDMVAFGSATLLGLDPVDSSSLATPIIAYPTGPGRDTLCLACLGKEELDYANEVGVTTRLLAPSLTGNVRTFWPGTGSILQITYSRRKKDGRGDNFLCVRRASHTSIFEPLLRRDVLLSSSDPRKSSLDPNPLITIDASLTGGSRHVDVAFHPLDHRRLAIVDETGNWSVWKISGQRSQTARVLYQARLRSSGKIFSWNHRARPRGIGLYFDGWHKIAWLSSDGQNIDRLLVCNRQTIRLFSLEGHELNSVDPRLDSRKRDSYIIDVRLGPRINLCLVMTATKVMVYDIAQKEWKDVGNRGPALLCAFQHFHNPADLRFRMMDDSGVDTVLLGLYSAKMRTLDFYQLIVSQEKRPISVLVSNRLPFALPPGLPDHELAGMVLTRPELAGDTAFLDRQSRKVVRVTVQYKDLSICSFSVTFAISHLSHIEEDDDDHLLKLPPSWNLLYKSKRYIDAADDEEEISIPVDFDVEEGETAKGMPASLSSSHKDTNTKAFKGLRYLNKLVDTIQEQQSVALSQARTSVSEALETLEARLSLAARSDETHLNCTTLAEALYEYVKIGDIQTESGALQVAIDKSFKTSTDLNLFPCQGRPMQPLLSYHDVIFDIFIGSLHPDVPDRFRVQKERSDRKVALDQYLSSYTVRRSPSKTDIGPGQPSSGEQIIVSDPIQYGFTDHSSVQQISASQPLPNASSTASGFSSSPASQKVSPLIDAISRLSSFTRIPRASLQEDLNPLETRHLSLTLSHLPTSPDAFPDNYDYHAVLLSADTGATAAWQEPHTADRVKLKASTSVKTRRRTEKISASFRSKDSKDSANAGGKDSRGMYFGDHRSSSADQGTLPIRIAGQRFLGQGPHDNVAQIRHPFHDSDGHLPIEMSSQGVNWDNLTATQPERGSSANRLHVGTTGQDKIKKRKKRVAGF